MDEMIKFNEERAKMVDVVLERIKKNKSRTSGGSGGTMSFRIVKQRLPDASQLFNTVEASNSLLESLQDQYWAYLVSLLETAKFLRSTKSSDSSNTSQQHP